MSELRAADADAYADILQYFADAEVDISFQSNVVVDENDLYNNILVNAETDMDVTVVI